MIYTDVDVQNAVADELQKAEGTLIASWVNICNRAHAWAYNRVVMMLAGKGYLLAQITSSDQLGPWEMSLSIWKALSSGAALQAVDDKLLESFDVRKDVAEMPGLTSGGLFLDPQGTAGQVVVGRDSDQGCVWSWPPSDGSRPDPGSGLGGVTRW